MSFRLLVAIALVYQGVSLGQTDIYDACRQGDVGTIAKLYQQQADTVNTPNSRGDTPLILASYYGHTEAVKMLLEYKVAVGINSSNGTALMGASYKGKAAIVELLLKHNANPNVVDESGATALIMAVFTEHTEVIELLLKGGADPQFKDGTGTSAYDYAKNKKNERILQLFGAD